MLHETMLDEALKAWLHSETIYLANLYDLLLVFMTLSQEQAEVKAPVDWIEATLISHS